MGNNTAGTVMNTMKGAVTSMTGIGSPDLPPEEQLPEGDKYFGFNNVKQTISSNNLMIGFKYLLC
jgi:hypothetical protein